MLKLDGSRAMTGHLKFEGDPIHIYGDDLKVRLGSPPSGVGGNARIYNAKIYYGVFSHLTGLMSSTDMVLRTYASASRHLEFHGHDGGTYETVMAVRSRLDANGGAYVNIPRGGNITLLVGSTIDAKSGNLALPGTAVAASHNCYFSELTDRFYVYDAIAAGWKSVLLT